MYSRRYSVSRLGGLREITKNMKPDTECSGLEANRKLALISLQQYHPKHLSVLVSPLLPTHRRFIRLQLHLMTLSDTNTLGLTPLGEGSARRRYNTRNRQTGFKPVIPARERRQTHALDQAATGTGQN